MSILSFFRNRNNSKNDRYILCIDGGGMRGIVPVMILQKLESFVREAGSEKALQKHFDLIAGTSTGGLISSGLVFPGSFSGKDYSGIKQVDFKAFEDIYMTVGKTIFPTAGGFRSLVNVPLQVITDKYPVEGLETLLDTWFGETKLSEAQVPTLLMAYNLSKGKEEMLRSYANDGLSKDMKASQACRATSAAPTFFASLNYEGNLLVDGGITANNPSLYAYLEAKKLYPDCKKFHILSIGTASQIHRTEDETAGLVNWIDQVSPMYMTAQKQTVAYAMERFDDVDYVRIDREFDEPVKMDDTRDSTMQKLRAFGIQIAQDYEAQLKDFASKLVR